LIKQKSILTVGGNLKDKYHPPGNREPLSIFYKEPPPDTFVKSPMSNTKLTEDISKKLSDVVYLMNNDN